MSRQRIVHDKEQVFPVPYNLRFNASTIERIKAAKSRTELTWGNWVSKALIYFQSQSSAEIEAAILVASQLALSSTPKITLPLRVWADDIDVVRKLSVQYGANIQAVFAAAMHLYSFYMPSIFAGIDTGEDEE